MLGLVVGLPLALWTNRWIVTHGERLKSHEEQARLDRALSVLAGALKFNRTKFVIVSKVLDEGNASLDIGVDYSAWDASRSEVTPYLGDPELQQRIAYHFPVYSPL